MNLMENLHTHTYRCGHATGEDREYVENAIRAGIRVLGFADHSPMLFPEQSGYYSGYRMRPEAFEGYVNSILELRREYVGEIELLIGAEMEYYPMLFQDTLSFFCRYPIDYLILGQHFIGNEYEERGLYAGNPSSDPDRLATYVDQVLEGLATGAFTYLAHPDVFRFTGDEADYQRENLRLLRGIKEMDIPVEFNFLGFREHRYYPRPSFWELVREVGNEVVVGLDAHTTDTFGMEEAYREMCAFLDTMGLAPLRHIPLRDPRRGLISVGD